MKTLTTDQLTTKPLSPDNKQATKKNNKRKNRPTDNSADESRTKRRKTVTTKLGSFLHTTTTIPQKDSRIAKVLQCGTNKLHWYMATVMGDVYAGPNANEKGGHWFWVKPDAGRRKLLWQLKPEDENLKRNEAWRFIDPNECPPPTKPSDETVQWVQCENDRCSKWRRLPEGMAPWDDTFNLGCFVCTDNMWDTRYNSCSKAEEKWQSEPVRISSALDSNVYTILPRPRPTLVIPTPRPTLVIPTQIQFNAEPTQITAEQQSLSDTNTSNASRIDVVMNNIDKYKSILRESQQRNDCRSSKLVQMTRMHLETATKELAELKKARRTRTMCVCM
jgi:hypothetical protein